MELETERIANDYRRPSPADAERVIPEPPRARGEQLEDAMTRIALLERDVAILAGVIESVLRRGEGVGRCSPTDRSAGPPRQYSSDW